MHKTSLTLPKKTKIKNIIKERCRLKGKESPKTLDNTSNISMKNRKGNNEINFSANTPDENNDNLNQINNTYRDNTLQKISQKYSELGFIYILILNSFIWLAKYIIFIF